MTACEWCIGEIGGEEPVEDPKEATHIVAGVPLCTEHAVEEVTTIIRDPGTFVHSWPTGEDRKEWGDAVPFYFGVRMIEEEEVAD